MKGKKKKGDEEKRKARKGDIGRENKRERIRKKTKRWS